MSIELNLSRIADNTDKLLIAIEKLIAIKNVNDNQTNHEVHVCVNGLINTTND